MTTSRSSAAGGPLATASAEAADHCGEHPVKHVHAASDAAVRNDASPLRAGRGLIMCEYYSDRVVLSPAVILVATPRSTTAADLAHGLHWWRWPFDTAMKLRPRLQYAKSNAVRDHLEQRWDGIRNGGLFRMGRLRRLVGM